MQRHLALMAAWACAACAGPDAGEAARQTVADTRASLAAIGAPAPLPSPAPPPPPTVLAPPPASSLAGQTEAQIRAALGEPSLRRAEGPVVVWLYTAAGCQLDVMFFNTPDGARVAYAQARAGGLAQGNEAACLAAVQREAARRRPARLEPMA